MHMRGLYSGLLTAHFTTNAGESGWGILMAKYSNGRFRLKAVGRAGGSIPSARCNVDNLASRRTLQKAGFVPCGVLIAGDLRG
jgi:hypothetical protein